MSTFNIGTPGKENEIALDSVFTSIQGEGLNTGIPMTFIRLWGCNLKCSFCDTPPADEPTKISPRKIIAHINEIRASNPNICITGGEPFNQPQQLYYLMISIRSLIPDAKIYIETNGAVNQPLVPLILRLAHYVSVSPKMGVEWNRDFFYSAGEVRCPIACVDDLENFDRGLDILDYTGPRLISPVIIGGKNISINFLIDWLKIHPEWRLSMQVHKLLDIL